MENTKIIKRLIQHYIEGSELTQDEHFEVRSLEKQLAAINYTRCCTELKSKECPMCNEEKDCEGHNVCEDCGGRSF